MERAGPAKETIKLVVESYPKTSTGLGAFERVIPLLRGVVLHGADRFSSLCPAHNDQAPSLSGRRIHHGLALHCFAGCSVEDVVSALGLSMADLFDEHYFSGRDPIVEHRRRALDGFQQWRDDALGRTAHQLRVRDSVIRWIDEDVRLGTMTEGEAWECLEPVLSRSSELEHKFFILRTGTDAEALEVYRHE